MNPMEILNRLQRKAELELRGDILPFWLKHTLDEDYGGFRGKISNDLTIHPRADKGLILNARILWTFSRVAQVYTEPVYGQTARRAYDYLMKFFWDQEYGGTFWQVDFEGHPVDSKKRTYGQAFTLYALAEYFRHSQDSECLNTAIRLYEFIEQNTADPVERGYFETYNRDWRLASDQRLSEVDMDEKKSMNTHLHILEAYANLLRVWENQELRGRLHQLIEVFLDHILDSETLHFRLFFDERWNSKSNRFSFGHDIEGSWLLCEAAEVLGSEALLNKTKEASSNMAQTVFEQALDAEGGLSYEGNPSGVLDTDRHWWPQAEAVVGFLNAYQISRREYFLDAASRSWDFIENHLLDPLHGEWLWKVSRDGVPSQEKSKVDMWKCPYHNSRACLEIMTRVDELRARM